MTPQFNKMQAAIENFGSVVSKAQADGAREMQTAIKNFADVVSKTQAEGVKKMVDTFLHELNASVGENFREVREGMEATSEAQGRYLLALDQGVKDITAAFKNINRVSTNLQNAAGKMETYVSRMQSMQQEMDTNIQQYAEQVARNNEIIKNDQQYLESIATAQTSSGEALNLLLSEVKDFTVRTEKEANKFIKTAEESTRKIFQTAEEWAELSNKTGESIDRAVKNAEDYATILAEQRDEQISGINEIKEIVKGDLTESAWKIEAAMMTGAEKMESIMSVSTEKMGSVMSTSTEKMETVITESAGKMGIVLSSGTDQLEKAATGFLMNIENSVNDGLKESSKLVQQATADLDLSMNSARTTIATVTEVLDEAKESIRTSMNQLTDQFQNMSVALEKMGTAMNERQVTLVQEGKSIETEHAEYAKNSEQLKNYAEQMMKTANNYQEATNHLLNEIDRRIQKGRIRKTKGGLHPT